MFTFYVIYPVALGLLGMIAVDDLGAAVKGA